MLTLFFEASFKKQKSGRLRLENLTVDMDKSSGKSKNKVIRHRWEGRSRAEDIAKKWNGF